MTTYTKTHKQYYQTHKQEFIQRVNLCRERRIQLKHERSILTLTPTDLAWVAGIIDGEGYIGVNKKYYKIDNRPETISYVLRVCVKMTDKKTIEYIHELFNVGTITTSKNPTGNRRPTYGWVCSARKAKIILQRILPYLITKRERAKLAIEFVDRRSNHNDVIYHIAPKFETLQREFFYNLFKAMNRRGKITK